MKTETEIKLRPVILPYSRTSISAKAISRYFGTLRVFPNRNYKPRVNDVLINYGFSGDISVIKGLNVKILNPPDSVQKASSKVDCLTILREAGVPVPPFATSKQEAEELFTEDDDKVFCRTLTRASKGKGIVIANNPEELVNCKLYTKALANAIEYRVHIVDGTIIDIVQKRKMSKERRATHGITEVNDQVRNLMNGWAFTRGGLTLKNDDGEWYHQLIDMSLETMLALNLDFAAIDLLKTPSDDFYVLEVNTAPGMKKGTTTHRRYVKAFSEVCNIDYSSKKFTDRYNITDTHEDNLVTFLNTYADD